MTADPDPPGNRAVALMQLPGARLGGLLCRISVVLVAYLTIGLCDWLFREASRPWLEALLPVAGLTLGFMLHAWLENLSRRT